jgi:CheY-like chemotaxis protein
MNGYEVARRLRNDDGLARPRLVALTGHAREEDRQRCREAGFDQHMTKPVEAEPLKALIASLPA